jgi:hypothetical protein
MTRELAEALRAQGVRVWQRTHPSGTVCILYKGDFSAILRALIEGKTA